MTSRIRDLWPYAAPLGFTITTVLHPTVQSGMAEIAERSTLWLTIHVVQILLILGLGLTLRWLVDGLPGRAAAVARAAVWVFVVVYAAFDAVVGIGTGVVARAATTVAGAQRGAVLAAAETLFTHPLGLLLAVVGSLAWLTAAIAAARAHRSAGEGRDVAAALVLAGLLLGLTHVGPPGLAGAFAMLYAIQRVRDRRRATLRTARWTAAAEMNAVQPSVAPAVLTGRRGRSSGVARRARR